MDCPLCRLVSRVSSRQSFLRRPRTGNPHLLPPQVFRRSGEHPISQSWRRHDCDIRSEEHTSELQSPCNLVCRLLLEKKKKKKEQTSPTTTQIRSRVHSHLAHALLGGSVSQSIHSASICFVSVFFFLFFFFFNDTATTEIDTLSLHDALPIYYAPTQILAEAFRQRWYDGIIYDSGLNKDGKNVALFNLTHADVKERFLYTL